MSGKGKGARVALTVGQIAEGIEECSQSAHDLYLSGVILHQQQVRTTARALLILAVEEYGKIGWLYRALMLPERTSDEWREWWRMFKLHDIKNEVGRMMMTHEDGLLPLLARFFRDRFPYFSVAPRALELEKQAMLYVDFEPESGNAISPRKYADRQRIENGPLIQEVEQLVRYVGHNKSSNVFHPEVLSAYRRLNEIAQDESDRVDLLRLFYGLVLKRSTGLVGEKPLDEVLEYVRRRYLREEGDLAAAWGELGRRMGLGPA